MYISRIPRSFCEVQLYPIFQPMGTIQEIRTIVDFGGYNKGFAFVRFTKKEEARRAVRERNNYEAIPGIIKIYFQFLQNFISWLTQCVAGMKMHVDFSVDNCRLYVNKIPKTKTDQEVLEEMQRISKDVVQVKRLKARATTPNALSAYCVQYASHK